MEPSFESSSDKEKQLVLRTEHPLRQHQSQQQLQLQPFQSHQQQNSLVSTLETKPTSSISLREHQSSLIVVVSSPENSTLIETTDNSNYTTVSIPPNTPALASTATVHSADLQAATAFRGSLVSHQHLRHQQIQQSYHQYAPLHQNLSVVSSSLLAGLSSSSTVGSGNNQQTIEKLSRPLAFDKMESLVREMQDPEHGVPVRQQKTFLTSIPYAFMGYDLVEWLMDRLAIEESEALNIANQLCLHGYFFPVNDTKTLTVKDDSSLYRFQTPYYWPWQHKAPDNVEYAIYLAKRSLRNKQRHALEDYEVDALASLHKNLKGKWDFISMQAEEQVRLAKERKKGDKIVGDSQERAYWRVHRPPPGQFTPLEPCPIPSRDRQGIKSNKKRTTDDVQREVDYLKKSLNRTRMKMSQACETLVTYSDTFAEYDFFLQPVLPSNPWVTEDITFWQLNNTFVEIPTEKRVKRWAISIEELVSDPTGLQEFTSFLEKEYSHENIRFWIAVNRLRRSAQSQVSQKVNKIFEEFLNPGAPCEINIDGKTMETVLKDLKNPSRFTFDAASEHIYTLLLKKDCYPRFIRSEHYKRLLESGIQPSHKKRFFNFGGVSGAKKKMTAALSNQTNLSDIGTTKNAVMVQAPLPGNLARRRGSDRSLSGSAHELAVIGVNKDTVVKVPHSHSQSNLSDIPYRDTSKQKTSRLETTVESGITAICPWDINDESVIKASTSTQVKLSVCPWDQDNETTCTSKNNSQRLTSTSSDILDISDRMQRNLGIRHQNTVDSVEASTKRLVPNITEQRRASMSFTPNHSSEYRFARLSSPTKVSSTPMPAVVDQALETVSVSLEPKIINNEISSVLNNYKVIESDGTIIRTDIQSSLDREFDERLNQISLSKRDSKTSLSELSMLSSPAPDSLPSLLTKKTPTTEAIENSKDIQMSKVNTWDKLYFDSLHESEYVIETEVEPIVKEVKIELVETGDYDNGCNKQKVLEVATLNIDVGESQSSEKLIDSILTKDITVHADSDNLKYEYESKTDLIGSEKGNIILDESQIECVSIEDLKSPLSNSLNIKSKEKKTSLLSKEEEHYTTHEELSPTTEEYQEDIQFDSDRKYVCDYDILDTESQTGYIPPAPTPAPSMAPLAELEDTVEDELYGGIKQFSASPSQTSLGMATIELSSIELQAVEVDELKKKRKKRNLDGKRSVCLENKEKYKDKEKNKPSTSVESSITEKPHTNQNTVCPWEDESISNNDGTFVKTYATLGYL